MNPGDGGARAVGVPGVVLVLAGSALVLVSYRFLTWYDYPQQADSVGQGDFGALRASAHQLGGAGIAIAYFDWMAWAVVIALILVGVAANLPVAAADGLRVIGFLLGVVGAGSTYYALAQHFNATGSNSGVFRNSTWGLWAVFAGFLIAAIGAGLGPRRKGTNA
jgi:hypothetical protein